MTEPLPAGDPSDAALVRAWQAGDERAASALVRRHASALGRFLYGAGAPADAVEDLVQEAFIKAFRALDGWRGEASFRSWLFRIGANLRKDQYRKERGRQMVEIEDRDLPAVSDPAGEIEASETRHRIGQGIAGLPRMQREVFLLRAQQGMDYEEIAGALGTSVGAARVHYHHAVKRLKELVA